MTQSKPQVNSYEKEDYWWKYQPFFPESVRITPERLPEETWWLWKDCTIHLDRYEVDNAPLTVLLLHGGGGHGRLLAPIGLMLQQQGYSVVAPDLPGYGLSICPKKRITYPEWVDCASDLLEAEKKRTGKPVVVFGLSLGGYLAYQVACQSRAAAGVIATTLADARLQIVRDQFAKNKWMSRLGLPLLIAFGGLLKGLRLPIKWFSKMHDIANQPALCEVVCADPLGGGNWTPLGFMRSLFMCPPVIEPQDFDLCPVLLAHPAADRWTTPEASLPFFDKIKGETSLVMLENCGHIPIEEPGISQMQKAIERFLQDSQLH